ncbi:hypothetical protein Tco_1219217 [Tanacetum coccineum]
MKAQSAIGEELYHSKTKHIEIRHHFIRDCYEKKLISVEKIHTDLNVADLLTKPFDGPRFNYLVVSIGIAWMKGRSAKYCDKHNQVGFLRKPDESAGFAEIVDFLRGSNLRYALTANPTIYDSLVKQFWQSAIANTKADGSLEINATIDTIRYTISEASIRDSLQLDDATGITMLPNADLFEGMGQIGAKTKEHLLSKGKKPSLSPSQEQLKSSPMDMYFIKFQSYIQNDRPDSEEEEPEAQGRKSEDDPLDSSVQGLVTPPTTKVNTSGEEQVEEISPNTAAKTLHPKVNTASTEKVNTASGVNTGSTKLSTGNEQVSTGGEQHYTNEDWDLIRAKIEANAELSKSMLGSELQGEDFAKKMVDLVNQRKKYFAEERARAKRNKPMTQSQLKTYMMNYLKNQGTWKLSQLKKLSFEEVKEEFDKLVKQVESFAPISFEATKASLKRFGEELQTKTPKRLKDDKDVEAKGDEPTKKSGRRKQMARKGMHTSVDENDSEDSDEVGEQEESTTGAKVIDDSPEQTADSGKEWQRSNMGGRMDGCRGRGVLSRAKRSRSLERERKRGAAKWVSECAQRRSEMRQRECDIE